MRFALAAALLIALPACAPAPLMRPVEAAHVLEAFAGGAEDAVDVCAPEGRVMLRQAVRSYAAAMAANGVAWPQLENVARAAPPLDALEASVAIAFAAGFVDASDLPQQARAHAQRLALEQWAHVWSLRTVARNACADMVSMQRAASRHLLETEHFKDAIADARRDGGEAAVAQLLRRNAVVQRAERDMRLAAALIQTRMDGAN